MSIKKQFGLRIKEIRKSKGYTQEQVAEKIGIEPPNVSKLEKGLHFPLPENIEKISKALKVEIKDLFDFNHFNNKSVLIKQIKEYIDSASDNDIEFLYKIIQNLKEYSRLNKK